MIDDSALFHNRSTYDPLKAREYYLRNRHLKGRRKGSVVPTSSSKAPSRGVSSSKKGSSRQEEIRAQRVALEKRLDRLREVLAKLVAEAKSRAGVEKTPTEKAKETASKNESAKGSSKLTAAQKRDRAKKAREDYQKEKKPSEKSIEELQQQISDIRAKIQAALEDARKNSTSKTAPKGR